MVKSMIRIFAFVVGLMIQIVFGFSFEYAQFVLFAFVFAMLFEDLFMAIYLKLNPPNTPTPTTPPPTA